MKCQDPGAGAGRLLAGGAWLLALGCRLLAPGCWRGFED